MMPERKNLRLIESFAQNIRLPFLHGPAIDTTHAEPKFRKCNATYFNQFCYNSSSCKSLFEIMFQTVIPTYFIGIQIKEFISRDHR